MNGKPAPKCMNQMRRDGHEAGWLPSVLSEHCQMAKKLEDAEIIEKMIVQLNPTRETIYPSFARVCQTLFEDGFNWYQIIYLFAFAGQLAVQCAQNGLAVMGSIGMLRYA